VEPAFTVTDVITDLGHDVFQIDTRMAERTGQRYAALAPGADPQITARFDRISGAAANVAGIMDWLDRTSQA
jgi:hypothetical protein